MTAKLFFHFKIKIRMLVLAKNTISIFEFFYRKFAELLLQFLYLTEISKFWFLIDGFVWKNIYVCEKERVRWSIRRPHIVYHIIIIGKKKEHLNSQVDCWSRTSVVGWQCNNWDDCQLRSSLDPVLIRN